ncbi:amidase domain-containing protein [Agromyces atrinae]|uniref:CHAP domain-containing protein n=1 Tax=Agromyces atrinae TaxID=592376 RepID=A0A4Q2MA56_9MICO|nr:amidase domain-containing protein [Agromyces atrinae]NYD67490.1 hypothetical protein [Agromyces atrinae]RXZ88287.1 hypothetical protein ESP50_03685 [Agromyces atrinae]
MRRPSHRQPSRPFAKTRTNPPSGRRRRVAEPLSTRRRFSVHAAAASTSVLAMAAVVVFAGLVAPTGQPVEATAEAATTDDSTIDASGVTAPFEEAKPDEPRITSDLSVAEAPVTGGTVITVEGTELTSVASVSIGGLTAPIVAATDETLSFETPAVSAESVGSLAVQFLDASGEPVVVGPATSTASVASVGVALDNPAPLAPTSSPAPLSLSLTLTYVPDPRVVSQMDYVMAHWSDYNTAEFTVISGNDCMNFTSQSLLARGWVMDAGWFYDASTGAYSPSWVSSTAFRDYLATRPDLGVELDDSQRDLVKVGDIAQFDWDSSGDRDHTAIVSRVERTESGTRIWVAGHTKDSDYWDVDEALTTGGGTVHYWSLN